MQFVSGAEHDVTMIQNLREPQGNEGSGLWVRRGEHCGQEEYM